ncbi:hypothetical protein JOC95_001879 [Bacillus tianshenii]|uniref:Integral membrane protein n=1 Tax=Sutcliffiella tianshenii TaxID=1463404 RepID=A0ABS2P062_9BACI|nr:hypothetical protein [Bacillus tianshenii]MBM7620027.1 hypothetical protein [Bacillus tianshenii]
MEVQVGGLVGLYGGAVAGILAWWFGRRMAKKQRGLDELHDHIWQKARAISWFFTLASSYLLFTLILFGIELKAGMILGVIILVHLASWAITGMVLSINMNMTEPLKPSRVKFGIAIVLVSLIIFTILSITTGNWWFLIASIPPTIIGVLCALASEISNEE